VKKILICDDENVMRDLVCATLDPGEFELVEACDGNEALEVARRERPDVILLDMMMPGRTGLEVARELRGQDEFADTPIIMLTARTQAADRDAAAEAGATRFLAKPFSPLELIALVEEFSDGGGP
jgi:CheY-like chemotaxis protein